MRICVLARGVPDGKCPLNGKYEWGMAVTLAKSGYEVIVIAVDLRIGKTRKKRGLDRFYSEGVEVWDYSIPVGRVGRRAAAKLRLAIISHYYTVLAEEGRLPDLTWGFFGRSFGSVVKGLEKRFGVPYAFTEYESRLLTEKLSAQEIKKLASVYGKAVAVTVPNEAFRMRMEKIFKVGFEFLPPPITLNTARKGHKGFVFLSIGALTVEKGMDVVIRAFAKIKQIRDDVKLIIVGNGDEKQALKEQAKALGVEKNVEFRLPGNGTKLSEQIAESDCFVLASRKELFGAIYIAALAAGVPVLTTDCFSPKGLIPPEAGKIVSVDDVYAMGEAMKEACGIPSPYSSEKIALYAAENFSVAAVAKKISDLLKKRKDAFPAPDIA